MKQVNFTHPGGFPLEQETLERLQTAYRSELFGALKGHLSIKTNKNYTITPATNNKKGWAIIHQEEKDPKDETAVKILQGILYPIEKGTPTQFLKTTRTGTNLTYGTGVLQTAYFDYNAKYITPDEYTNRPAFPSMTDALTVYYYDLNDFEIVKDIEAIETIIQAIKTNIVAIEANIDGVEANIDKIEADINVINQTYLPLNGSKAMEGDLDLSSYKLSKLDTKEASFATVRAADFRLGSVDRKGKLNPGDSTGRALVDSSDDVSTSLSFNYKSDWKNTNIGGKVYLDNLNTSTEDFKTSESSENSLLLMDNINQVIKSNNLLNSLLSRISILEKRPATAVPIGMIAIWGKTAPFPEGWEEYVPLRGRIPLGLDISQTEFSIMGSTGGSKNKLLTIEEIPPHTHTYEKAVKGRGYQTRSDDSPLGSNLSETSGSAGGGQAFSLLNPYKIVQFIEYTGRPIDTTAPVNPPNLRVADVGRTFVSLEWTPSQDDRGITNYLIYKDNVLTATVSNILFYAIGGLSRSRTYNFYIVATDAAGNLSPVSNTVTAKTNLL